ncbi:MAG TPA: hypothetical protein QF753_02750 [Victivallales bacterium]|jgi:arginine repressor|nr:hypothetical protein [Victivallales bacterium]|tara:strand:- start:5417 stop:5692 length:276 start_codon:yes stop_codon:yes gene_type:complete
MILDPDDLYNDASRLKPKVINKFKINKYRKTVIILKIKGYKQKEIVEYFNNNGMNISQPKLSKYLKEYPIHNRELEEQKEYLKILIELHNL